MSGADHDRIKSLLFAALELPAAQRDDFVARSCPEPAVRERVRALLAAHGRETLAFGPVSARAADGDDAPPARAPDDAAPRIARYALLRVLGEGGFGTVHLAEQSEPVRRTVAIKVLKPGMHSAEIVRRFQQERQALALMSHPGIAQVYDAGTTEDGRPFVVMEHVDGLPIVQWCDRHRLPIRGRLELFAEVCRAVQHAHQKGVVHRDLKPSNVLVTEIDGRPRPKVIDFGIAKALEPDPAAPDLTAPRQVVGTPQYMAPEQADADGARIDTRTDVYALGVLLYELLVGTPPIAPERFANANLLELVRIVREDDPARPSTRVHRLGEPAETVATARRLDAHRLAQALAGELDWIVMRAIEKDPERRYPTANALADDVRRHLAGEPVEAGPPGRLYRLSKFARRHRIELAALALAAVTIVALAAGGIWFGLASRAAERRTAEELVRAEAFATFAREMIGGVDPAEARGMDTELLQRILATARARIDEALGAHPAAAADMLLTIGSAHLSLGEHDAALAAFEDAERMLAERRPDDHGRLAGARTSQGVALMRLSRYDDALPRLERAHAEARQRLGPDHPETLSAQSNLGGALHETGRDAEAAPILEDLVARRRRQLGDDHRDVRTVMNNLAATYLDLGRTADAVVLLEAVLRGQVAELGEEHPRTLATLNNIAHCQLDLERDDEAEATFRRVLAVKRRILPDDHPGLVPTLVNLASVLVDRGAFADAEPLALEARDVAVRAAGPDSMEHVGALNVHGRLLLRAGRLADAEPVTAQAAEIVARIAGPVHPNTVVILANLAGLRLDLDRPADAEATIGTTVTAATARLGPDHPAAVSARLVLARAVAAQDGRLEEARALVQGGLDACRALDAPRPGTIERLEKAFAELAPTP